MGSGGNNKSKCVRVSGRVNALDRMELEAAPPDRSLAGWTLSILALNALGSDADLTSSSDFAKFV